MKKDYKSDYILKDILSQRDTIDSATNELLVTFNEMIQKYHLNGQGAMATVAQLSALYVHGLKKGVSTPEEQDILEDMFEHTFNTFLALFDLQDIQEEISKEERRKLN